MAEILGNEKTWDILICLKSYKAFAQVDSIMPKFIRRPLATIVTPSLAYLFITSATIREILRFADLGILRSRGSCPG